MIIKLPDAQLSGVRETKSGLFVAALKDKLQHDFSCGEVIATGDNCSICQVGDIVFFDYYSVSLGLRNAGRDITRHDATKNTTTGVPIWLIENSNIVDVPELPHGLFLVMPENRLVHEIVAKSHLEEQTIGGSIMELPLHLGIICLIRNGEIVACNNYHLLKEAYGMDIKLIDGVNVRQTGLIQSVVLNKEQNKNRKYEVVCAPDNSPYKKGDIVFTESNIEIPIEGQYNYPQFADKTYYCEPALILWKEETLVHQIEEFKQLKSAS